MSTVVIVEYQADWPAAFQQVADELALIGVGTRAMDIEHIGSTSVPGLCAKPVIDVLVGAPDLAVLETRVAALARRGYRYRPAYEAEIPDRRYFVKDAGAHPRVHVHGVVRDGPVWRRHLAFRDALRHDAALAGAYAELKRSLAVQHAQDKAAYSAAKGPFIERVLRDQGEA